MAEGDKARAMVSWTRDELYEGRAAIGGVVKELFVGYCVRVVMQSKLGQCR